MRVERLHLAITFSINASSGEREKREWMPNHHLLPVVVAAPEADGEKESPSRNASSGRTKPSLGGTS